MVSRERLLKREKHIYEYLKKHKDDKNKIDFKSSYYLFKLLYQTTQSILNERNTEFDEKGNEKLLYLFARAIFMTGLNEVICKSQSENAPHFIFVDENGEAYGLRCNERLIEE